MVVMSDGCKGHEGKSSQCDKKEQGACDKPSAVVNPSREHGLHIAETPWLLSGRLGDPRCASRGSDLRWCFALAESRRCGVVGRHVRERGSPRRAVKPRSASGRRVACRWPAGLTARLRLACVASMPTNHTTLPALSARLCNLAVDAQWLADLLVAHDFPDGEADLALSAAASLLTSVVECLEAAIYRSERLDRRGVREELSVLRALTAAHGSQPRSCSTSRAARFSRSGSSSSCWFSASMPCSWASGVSIDGTAGSLRLSCSASAASWSCPSSSSSWSVAA